MRFLLCAAAAPFFVCASPALTDAAPRVVPENYSLSDQPPAHEPAPSLELEQRLAPEPPPEASATVKLYASRIEAVGDGTLEARLGLVDTNWSTAGSWRRHATETIEWHEEGMVGGRLTYTR